MYHAIDMHCDTLMHAFLHGGDQADVYQKPDLNLDVARLIQGGALAQFFAIFIVPEGVYHYFGMEPVPVDKYIAGCAQVFENTLARYPEITAKALNAADVERNHRDGKLSMILTMEDGVAVNGDMKVLDKFYDMGVRALSLTWNAPNCFGAPNSRDAAIMQTGLTPFGKEAVSHMQDIGMLVDVSHLSDGGFWDVCELARVPFVATHSNCRALCNHPRNMTDDMIKALASKGGVMGLNFGPEFLDDTPDNHVSAIERMVAMALHIKKIGGSDTIGIGTDFDGIEGQLEIGSPDKMHLLADALACNGFSSDEIDRIFSGNVMRVMKEAMK
ncbi:MAG: dipeptidase [Firmicutes bacterium]|nr:dipeptidase [Bacillota bacterium]